jgi:hypothetical protein
MSLKPQIMRTTTSQNIQRKRKLPRKSIGWKKKLGESQLFGNVRGATMVGGMIGGSPADEDDAI